jgi:hypothetical protein
MKFNASYRYINNYAKIYIGFYHSLTFTFKGQCHAIRVSYETSFDSKQQKLEPKLVSTLSESRRLFRLFRFIIETGRFGVSIELK